MALVTCCLLINQVVKFAFIIAALGAVIITVSRR